MSSSILIRETKNGLSFDIHVNPHASRAGISGISEGAANEACIDLLAKSLKLRKSQMKISTGAKGRKKTILVSEIGKTDLERKIHQLETGHSS